MNTLFALAFFQHNKTRRKVCDLQTEHLLFCHTAVLLTTMTAFQTQECCTVTFWSRKSQRPLRAAQQRCSPYLGRHRSPGAARLLRGAQLQLSAQQHGGPWRPPQRSRRCHCETSAGCPGLGRPCCCLELPEKGEGKKNQTRSWYWIKWMTINRVTSSTTAPCC